MTDFLPKDYKVPNTSDNYMKFEQGSNRFRILASPIIGWESWIDDPDTGKRKPVRGKTREDILGEVADIKHFWAMPVFNYEMSRIQVLEVTQKTIMKAIMILSADSDWGSPLEYDLTVGREGEGLDTEYAINPKPKKKLDAAIAELWANTHLNLEALYSGDDPFADVEAGVAGEPAKSRGEIRESSAEAAPQEELASPPKKQRIFGMYDGLAKHKGIEKPDPEKCKEWVKSQFGLASFNDLTDKQALQIIGKLSAEAIKETKPKAIENAAEVFGVGVSNSEAVNPEEINF